MTKLFDSTAVAAYKFCGQANLQTVEGLLELASQLNTLASLEIQHRATVNLYKPVYLKRTWLADNRKESKVTEFALEQWKSSMPGMVVQNHQLGTLNAAFFGNMDSQPVVTFVPSLKQMEINHANQHQS